MSKRPNILHLFTDQQRADTIAALGNPVIKTPNLDRLVRSGVAFTNAFTPSPVCVPARCSMIYGQYPLHTGLFDNGRMPTDGRQTFMGALSDAGYRTHGIGKCHFTPDPYALRGFQTRDVQEEGGGGDLERNPYIKALWEAGQGHVIEPHGVRGEMYYVPQPSQLPARLHPTQWVGDRAVAFIEEQAKKQAERQPAGAAGDEPWYLYASFIHPHPPFAPPTPWHKLYRGPLMPLPFMPDDAEALHVLINRHQNRYKYRDQGRDQNLLRMMKAYYYACISFVDHQVGRILDALEASGQLENTLILFTSDHGELLGDYGCVGKRSLHDAAARVPFILSRPGHFEGGRTCDTPVSLVDIAPTFLAAAGAELTTHALDGVDLHGLYTGEIEREMVFAQFANRYNPEIFARRYPLPDHYAGVPEFERAAMSIYLAVSRDWKYVYSAPDQKEFLFDRRRDPQESRNIAGFSLRREALAQMRQALFAHLRQGGETAGIDGERWRTFPRVDLVDDPDAGLLIQDLYTPWADLTLPGYSD